MLAAQHELELSAGSEPEVDLELLKLLGEDLAGEDLAGGDLAGPLPEQQEDVPEGSSSSAAKYEAARRGPREEDAHLRRGHRARPTHRGFCEGRGGIKLAT